MKSETTAQAIEASAAGIANKATYAGAGVTISGGIMLSEAAVILGMIIGVLGLLVNWYYRAKEDKRSAAEHERRMKDLE